ncbi:hypothetical protein PVAND_013525 [Polypedilum vanderplanki]|uniref:Uncharacterized protein n=1 Tax=Polypedilum vanderplanki TaxID=319348 RepID=A0A9J6CPY7_POLVA|nr:hypothetical protein PVAND_013525 [Polypedilum vanderplanki]
MAVVQLRFDGKYAYSTIADIHLNQPHIIENQISITSERRSRIVEVQGDEEEEEDCQDNNNKQESVCICEHKKDLHERCRSLYNHSQNGACRYLSRSPMNSHSPNSATSSPTIKFCICNFHNSNNHHNNNSKNKQNRSESIKVENWDFIYRERAFLDVSHADRNVAVPKSPQNGFSQLDHGRYLSGLGAQKLDTIFRHYYPESGFGWIILVVAIIVAIFTHGFQLSAILFLLPALNRFQADKIDCLGELKIH